MSAKGISSTVARGPVRNGGKAMLEELKAMGSPRMLELGTRRSDPDVSTMHRDYYPFAGEYIGTDIQPGLDVDVVSDLHSLSRTFGEESFDAIISFSTFEHIKYPILAAHEIMKTLKIGGHLFIQTHFAFHEHSYPYDYFRFTRDGLASLFPPTMNFTVRSTDYAYPCEIRCEAPYLRSPAFLNVHLWGVKAGKTPESFIWDLDDLVP
jgi:SAM-dependent methyltransferase